MAAHNHSFYPTCLLLDLDDTLYQVAEIPDIVRRNIQGESCLIHLGSSGVAILRCLIFSVAGITDPRGWYFYAGYMRTKLKIPEEDIAPLCLEYYTNYGTTMAGLVV